MSLKSFEEFVKNKGGVPYVFSEKIPPKSISADSEGDEEGMGLLGSPQMMDKEQPPLTRVEKKDMADPEYTKNGEKLKTQKEGVELVEHRGESDDLSMSSIDGGKFSPSISEVASYTAKLIKKHPHTAEHFVRNLKKHGSFEGFIAEAVEHPETFACLANHIGHDEHGPRHSKKMVKALMAHHTAKHAIKESVDGPRGGDFGGGMPSAPPAPMGVAPMPVNSDPTGLSPTTGMSGMGGSGNLSTSQAPPAVQMPAPSESAHKGEGYHNLVSEMSKEPEMHDAMRECCGMGY
jgi:hypothetical protein